MRRLMILVVAVVLLAPSTVLAGVKYLPSSDWTPQEEWVWKQVSRGKIADFNKTEGYGGKLSPIEPEGWKENRILRPKFLETILLQEPYRNDLTHRGVRIAGAWFKEPVDLSNATIPSQLWLNGSRFEQDVDLSFLKLPFLLSLEGSVFVRSLNLARAKIEIINMSGSTFNGTLNMESLEVGSHLFMSKARFADVDLVGAKIEGQLDMSSSTFNGTLIMNGLEVGSGLFMRDKAQFAEVDLKSAKTEGQLDMSSSTFNGTLNMDSLEVGSSLFMRDKAQFADVVLRGTKIEGQLSMIGSTFNGTLDMDGLEVGSSLLMRDKAQFADVVLRRAKIEGQLDMSSSTFNGTLIMNGLEVGSSLFMRDKAQFADVDLRSAKIEGQLDMSSSTFNGTLNMDSLEVGSHLFMRDAVVEKPILLSFARIQGGLDISGAALSSLNLTGTKVVQEFWLGSGFHHVKWKDNSELILRNTEVGNLQDVPQSWPDTLKLQLDGFVYQRLGGLSGNDRTDMATREISWLKEWLEKQKSYSPRPYQQLAQVLENAGYEEKATAILFEGKKRQQKETKTLSLNWLWLVLQRIFIGYGYHNFRVLGPVLILWGLGVLTLHLSGQKAVRGMECWGLWYSLDMLLPIIELDTNYDIAPEGWVRVYFYIHKIFGYVLALFLIAGLSGLTKM
jgi:uncharacterized protein YjbI with pentapeptide repeats